MDIQIHKANPTDLNEVLALNKKLFEFERQFGSTYNLDWTYSECGQEYYKKRLENERAIVLIAKTGSKSVGYILGFIDTYSYRSVNPILEIENMFVEEAYRRQGIGKKLAQELLVQAKNRGVKRIRVGALAQNTNAIKFYKSLGLSEFEVFLEVES
jgi:diamine N-acetyltransferase